MLNYGCCLTHIGQSHEEWMDKHQRDQNEGMLKRAVELAKSSRFIDRVSASALWEKGVEQEIARLQAKRQWIGETNAD